MKKISFRNDVLPLKNQLYRLALRITLNQTEAEDIVQDTLIKVWSKRDYWPEINCVDSFCLSNIRNRARNRIKKNDNDH